MSEIEIIQTTDTSVEIVPDTTIEVVISTTASPSEIIPTTIDAPNEPVANTDTPSEVVAISDTPSEVVTTTATNIPTVTEIDGKLKILVKRIRKEVLVVIPPSRRYAENNSNGRSLNSKRFKKKKHYSDDSETSGVSSESSDEQEPEIFTPRKSTKRRNLIMSSDESDVDSTELKSINVPYISNSDNEPVERPRRSTKANKIKETLLYKKQKMSNPIKSDHENDSQSNYVDTGSSGYDSIVSEADFIVENISEDDEGLSLLPELFSREQGSRTSFDTFIKALIKTVYNSSYLSKIKKNDFDTHRGYQQIIAKAKSYCTDLANSHSWTTDFLAAIYNFPKFTSEIMVSAEENAQEIMRTLTFEGTPYNHSTLEPFFPLDIAHRFILNEKSYHDSILCHRLYHYHKLILDELVLISEKIASNPKNPDVAPIKILFKKIKKKDMISKWFTTYENLLDESVKRTEPQSL